MLPSTTASKGLLQDLPHPLSLCRGCKFFCQTLPGSKSGVAVPPAWVLFSSSQGKLTAKAAARDSVSLYWVTDFICTEHHFGNHLSWEQNLASLTQTRTLGCQPTEGRAKLYPREEEVSPKLYERDACILTPLAPSAFRNFWMLMRLLYARD